MNRRGFLTLLGLAPVTAAAVKAGITLTPEPKLPVGTSVLLCAADAPPGWVSAPPSSDDTICQCELGSHHHSLESFTWKG